MGTGIGKDCEICGNQLNYDTGFNADETLCNTCNELIPKVINWLSIEKLKEIERNAL